MMPETLLFPASGEKLNNLQEQYDNIVNKRDSLIQHLMDHKQDIDASNKLFKVHGEMHRVKKLMAKHEVRIDIRTKQELRNDMINLS